MSHDTRTHSQIVNIILKATGRKQMSEPPRGRFVRQGVIDKDA